MMWPLSDEGVSALRAPSHTLNSLEPKITNKVIDRKKLSGS
jgi:hypothetical protein